MPPPTRPAAPGELDPPPVGPSLRDETWLRVVRGMGLGLTGGLAAVGIAQVLATGDPAQVTALLGNLTAGAIGSALSAWSAAGKQPSLAEIADLLAAHQDELAAQRTALAGLAVQTGLLRQTLQELEPHAVGDLLTPAELERQFTLFGSNLIIAVVDLIGRLERQMDAGFSRLDRLLAVNPALGSAPQPLDQALAYYTVLAEQLAQRAAVAAPAPALVTAAGRCVAHLVRLRQAQQAGATVAPPAPDEVSLFSLLVALPLPGVPGAAVGPAVFDQHGQVVGSQVNVAGNLFVLGQSPPPEPTPRLIGVEPGGPPKVFVGRQAELLQLDRALDAVTPSANRPSPPGKLVLIYGDGGAGKRELLRRWLATVAAPGPTGQATGQATGPRVARITFTPAELNSLQEAAYYRTQPVWRIDWERYGQALARAFPQLFAIGSHPWVALAAQIVAQSDAARRLLDTPAAVPDLDRDNAKPPEAALMALLRAAVADGRPLVLALEQFHAAPDPWLTLVQAWEQEIRAAHLPVLLVLTYDYPLPLARPEVESPPADVLAWLRHSVNAPYGHGQGLFLTRLRLEDVEQLLAPTAADYALDLYALTEGIPHLVEELLAHWQERGLAEPGPDGRWRVVDGLPYNTPGVLYDELVAAPLAAAAARGVALGLDAATLRRWLDHAVWEGPVFTARALERIALAGPHPPADHDNFEDLLDDVLCDPDDPDAGLVQFDGFVDVPVPGQDETQPFSRYRFCPPLVAHILRQRQDVAQRRTVAAAYGQALEATYALAYDAVLPQLIALYQAAGLPAQADAYRKRARIEQTLASMQATLEVAKVVATEEVGQRRLVGLIVEYVMAAYHRRHGRDLLPWLELGLRLVKLLGPKRREAQVLNLLGVVHIAIGDYKQALVCLNQVLPLHSYIGDKYVIAATLNNMARAHNNLGDLQQALDYYNEALPLLQEVGDKAGEAATRHNIAGIYKERGEWQQALDCCNLALALSHLVGDKAGEATILTSMGVAHSALDDQQQALGCCNQALSLSRQIGDKFGEAHTLASIGVVYSVVGDPQQAMGFYNLALPLHRQVGDQAGERETRWNIAMVAAALSDLDRAVAELEQVVTLDEALQHPDLERDRAELARMRARRDAGG